VSKTPLTLFRLHDERGVPLSLAIQVSKRNGTQLDVPGFFKEALAAGWTLDKALATIDGAFCDAGFERSYIDAVKTWLTDDRPAVVESRRQQAEVFA
jgi:hypothetical protein